MRGWTEGYPEGVDYTYGYYPELNPLRLQLAFLNAGFIAPASTTACELGFGEGISLNLHAAASTTEWFGTDFNPAHASFARELAAASGAAVNVTDQPFAEFCSRADLPDFDFIGLHGVWSWISDRNRDVVADFLRRKLRVGGVLYVSYNTLAGNAAFLPVQELLTRHVEIRADAGQRPEESIAGALEFAASVLAASPQFSESNPHVAKRLATLRGENPTYLVHEYVNREWAPMSFARLAEWLEPAKLSYACSARFADSVDGWNLNADQQAMLGGISDLRLRETLRDFMMNRWFRTDYWIKGPRRLAGAEKIAALRRQRVVLTRLRGAATPDVQAALGKAVPPRAICDPVLDALADHRPKTLGQIEQAVREPYHRSRTMP
jgi:hypothetical protein